jgi:hypothetical protein
MASMDSQLEKMESVVDVFEERLNKGSGGQLRKVGGRYREGGCP